VGNAILHASRQVVRSHRGREIRVMDSVASMTPDDGGHLIVTGSHGGTSAAEYVTRVAPLAVACSDAGVGKNQAGVAGLKMLDASGIAGIGVSHRSARIGEGMDLWRHGQVSYANETALRLGVAIGAPLQRALEALLESAPSVAGKVVPLPPTPILKRVLARHGHFDIVAMDSISILEEAQRGQVIVSGSHGGSAAGEMARRYACAFVALSDAGIGKDEAGVAGLKALDQDGIPAVGISHDSAEISNALDIWENGQVSFANCAAQAIGITTGDRLRDAVDRFLATPQSGAAA
jgi:hypothetical protein